MFQRCALMFLAVFAVLTTCRARAASIQQISPSECVWHVGDSSGWAASGVDESGWKPLSSWTVTTGQPWMWVRCHANLAELRQASQPALQVNALGAYQLFLNGKLAGQNGNLSNGQISSNPQQTFSVAADDLAAGMDTVALRFNFRQVADRPQISAGEADWLRDRHYREALIRAENFLPVAGGFGIICVLGFVLLGLYLNDRSHLELLLLAAVCWGMFILRLVSLFDAAMVPLSDRLVWSAVGLGVTLDMAEVWFMFRLTGRRVPFLYKFATLAFGAFLVLHSISSAFLPVRVSLSIDVIWIKWVWPMSFVGLVMATAPFAAFWPWRKIPKGMRAMAGCAMLWGCVHMLWFVGHPFDRWRVDLVGLRAFGIMAAIIALVALLFRDYRRTAEERAILAGEMQAAQQIQRILAPAAVDTAAGARVEVAFRPMRDVGGDFYLCRALADGRQRVLLGDVSGKGAAAAMTATLLIGAAERRDTDSPAELLHHLNLVLHASQVGGFATCLCADLEPDGSMTLANAGHLSPYLHGEEMALAPGLPLGLSASHGIYEERRLQLAEGETLTFLSDGVVEARSATGELFGFERTQAMSSQTAGAIADAAEKYGQQDDITVLTLTRASMSVHERSEPARL